MVLYNKYIYIYGGKTPQYLSKNLFRLNLEKNQVTNLKYSGDIPTPRFGHSADVYKANMYVFGGWNGQETVDELFYFSLISNIWYEVRLVCGIKPKGRYRHTTMILEKSLFVFGGVDQKQRKFNDLYEFLLEKNEWRTVEVKGNIPTPRSFHQSVNVENRLFVFGGTDEKKLNDFYYLILPMKGTGFQNIPEKKTSQNVSLFENQVEI
jgi:N-acetylneuraminic acid mutarotase